MYYNRKRSIFWGLLSLIIFESCSKSISNSNGSGGGGTPLPRIDSLSYSSGIIGDTIKIIGVNISTTGSNNTVEFNGVKANIVSSGPSFITCIVPAGAKTGDVSLTVNGQTATNSITFTVVPVDIYVTAVNMDGVGLIFRNGNLIQMIQAKGGDLYFTGIYVAGNDVYVCGTGYSNGLPSVSYWKNGLETVLASSDPGYNIATSIWVSGNDIYVTGADDGSAFKYWKNDVPVVLTNGSFTSAITSSVLVSGNDLYITGTYASPIYTRVRGYDSVISQTAFGACWKNGIPVKLMTAKPSVAFTNLSTCVLGNDVYVAGTVVTSDSANHSQEAQAAYWKNGAAFYLGQPGDGFEASGIYVSGNDVYVAGISTIAKTGSPFYWKNSNLVYLPQIGGVVYGISGNGSDFYLIGWTGPQDSRSCGYWVNGEFNNMSNLYNNLAAVTGIFLKKTP
jgi:hypothetical protein